MARDNKRVELGKLLRKCCCPLCLREFDAYLQVRKEGPSNGADTGLLCAQCHKWIGDNRPQLRSFRAALHPSKPAEQVGSDYYHKERERLAQVFAT